MSRSSEDRELFERWRTGDARAGNALFTRHFDAVYRFFRNKVTSGAEDLVQQTFLACVRAKNGFRNESSFRTYLFAVARSKLYDELRKRHGSDQLDFSMTSLVDMGISPTGLLAQREEQRIALAVLRSLPLELQIALELFHVEKLRGCELAEVLGIPEGTVRSRLRRGRLLLQERAAKARAEPALATDTLDNLEAWAASLPVEGLLRGERGEGRGPDSV